MSFLSKSDENLGKSLGCQIFPEGRIYNARELTSGRGKKIYDVGDVA